LCSDSHYATYSTIARKKDHALTLVQINETWLSPLNKKLNRDTAGKKAEGNGHREVMEHPFGDSTNQKFNIWEVNESFFATTIYGCLHIY